MERRIIKSTIAMAVVAMFGLMLAVPAVSAQGAQAPQWNKGDSWAMGTSVTVDQDDLQDLSDGLNSSLGNGVNEFDANAFVGAWVLFKVADVTADEYEMQGRFAARLNGGMNLSIGVQMPAPGKYSVLELLTVPKTTRNITMHLVVDAAMVLDSQAVLDKSTVALKSYDLTLKVNAKVGLDMTGVPDLKVENGYVTYSYSDVSTTVTLKFDAAIHIVFSPALDVFDFPITVGEHWNVRSNATLTGSFSGQLDATGLPQYIQEEVFKADLLKKANITGFPIDLTKLVDNDVPPVHNGTIGPTTQEIDVDLHCTSNYTMTLPFHGLVEVYEIRNGTDRFFYSDDIHFLGAANLTAMETGMPVDMGMESMSPQTAEQQINAVSDYRAEIAGENQDGGLASLGSTAVLGGLVVVLIVAVLVISMVLLRRRKP
jgi:hypothetical protein